MIMYMKKMNRRVFIKTGAAGLAGISIIHSGLAGTNLNFQQNVLVDLAYQQCYPERPLFRISIPKLCGPKH